MKDTDSLDDYLAGGSELSDLYARSKSEQGSSEAADSAILAAARRELDTAPQNNAKLTRNRIRRWSLPLSTAAVVLISTTLYFTQESVIQQSAFDDVSTTPLLKKSATPSSQTAVKEAAPRAPMPSMAEEAQVERSFMEAPQPLHQVEQEAAADFAAPMAAPEPKRGLSNQLEQRAGAFEMPLQDHDLRSRAMAPDVETWLERIQALDNAGETDEARRQLALLVQAYPDASLPGWAKALMVEE